MLLPPLPEWGPFRGCPPLPNLLRRLPFHLYPSSPLLILSPLLIIFYPHSSSPPSSLSSRPFTLDPPFTPVSHSSMASSLTIDVSSLVQHTSALGWDNTDDSLVPPPDITSPPLLTLIGHLLSDIPQHKLGLRHAFFHS